MLRGWSWPQIHCLHIVSDSLHVIMLLVATKWWLLLIACIWRPKHLKWIWRLWKWWIVNPWVVLTWRWHRRWRRCLHNLLLSHLPWRRWVQRRSWHKLSPKIYIAMSKSTPITIFTIAKLEIFTRYCLIFIVDITRWCCSICRTLIQVSYIGWQWVSLLPKLMLSMGKVSSMLHLASSCLLKMFAKGGFVLRHFTTRCRYDRCFD